MSPSTNVTSSKEVSNKETYRVLYRPPENKDGAARKHRAQKVTLKQVYWSSPDKVDSRRLSCRDRRWTLREALLELLHHAGGDRLLAGLRAWFSNLAKLLRAAFLVELKSIGNRVAMHAQVAGRSASAFGLSSLHEQQHVEVALDLSVSLLAIESFEPLDRLGDLRKVVHGRRRFLRSTFQAS